MADTQIRGLGESPAPLTYTVPGAQEIVLKSLFASFDGTAAASAWFPCVRVRAPGGGIVGEYITQASVAAGSSADVSFAPFLRGATAGSTPVATGGLPNAVMIKTNTQTVAGNTTVQLTLDSTTFATTDGTVFTASGSNIVIHATGLYAAYINTVPDNTDPDPTLFQLYPKWLGGVLNPDAPWQLAVPRIFNVNGPSGLRGYQPDGNTPELAHNIDNWSIAYVSELNGTVGAWMAALSATGQQYSTCLLVVMQLQPIASLAGFPSYPL